MRAAIVAALDALDQIEDDIGVASLAVHQSGGDYESMIAGAITGICVRVRDIRSRLAEATGTDGLEKKEVG